jgi:hypothetical protein
MTMADPDYYTVRITRSGAHVTLIAPYHGDLPKRAREIGGTWDKGARAWAFPAEREEQARDLARLLFKTDDGPVPKDLDRRSTHERKLGDAGKKRGAKGKKGLAAYSTDDLLAELRRRGVVPAAPASEPQAKPKAESGAERAARLNARRGAEHVTRNDAGDGNDPDLFSL